ncbi:uncharacterized protein LAESUDRAFT_312088 [Laetiporus sulphureus 93-53]|uniref:Uncharacterized protein n=1 Tax=Laetiporus sulphureus 93-53 TaxID=1314785 RepID=A0A165D4Z6_9APHY|nr:uncharacterized protein LAESUDRAFT_312088 [Laetiporus sulphureus 93-53]KZT04164.1 hypothetical protein LAESUDRAFT_312088 [Laetiporus sulphureus 93-53]
MTDLAGSKVNRTIDKRHCSWSRDKREEGGQDASTRLKYGRLYSSLAECGVSAAMPPFAIAISCGEWRRIWQTNSSKIVTHSRRFLKNNACSPYSMEESIMKSLEQCVLLGKGEGERTHAGATQTRFCQAVTRLWLSHHSRSNASHVSSKSNGM